MVLVEFGDELPHRQNVVGAADGAAAVADGGDDLFVEAGGAGQRDVVAPLEVLVPIVARRAG